MTYEDGTTEALGSSTSADATAATEALLVQVRSTRAHHKREMRKGIL